MNNRRRIWRIHHIDDFERGLYRTCKNDNRLEDMKKFLMVGEPFTTERKHWDIEKWNKKEKLTKKRVYWPPGFFLRRPGLLEDPVLKDNLIKRYGGLKWEQTNKFAFDSLTQLFEWFSESDIEKLKEFGYEVFSYLVPEEDIIHGQKQCVFRDTDVVRLLNNINQ